VEVVAGAEVASIVPGGTNRDGIKFNRCVDIPRGGEGDVNSSWRPGLCVGGACDLPEQLEV
jgi:hypothetical protein